MPDLQIDSIGQIHITVSDIDAAVTFYRDKLGMKFLFDVPGQSMAFLDCGGIRIYLGQSEGLEQGSSPMIYYRVGDIDAACASLVEREVPIEHPAHVVHRTDTMELWMAMVRDPDGNYVSLMEERSKEA